MRIVTVYSKALTYGDLSVYCDCSVYRDVIVTVVLSTVTVNRTVYRDASTVIVYLHAIVTVV